MLSTPTTPELYSLALFVILFCPCATAEPFQMLSSTLGDNQSVPLIQSPEKTSGHGGQLPPALKPQGYCSGL